MLGPASYGMTDTMGRMHSDAQFAGSSSVPAHVEMMGFLGIGNNPMVGCTVACAVDVAQASDAHAEHLFIDTVLFCFAQAQDDSFIPLFFHRASPSLS